MVAFVADLVRRDVAGFGLVTVSASEAPAYALVRLREWFLYSDVMPRADPTSRRPTGCGRPSS